MDNEKIIQRPPRIYLDTNHLINIAKVRKGNKPQPASSEEDYRNIDKFIKSCGCLIFNPYAALEWVEGRATIDSAREIAAVVDSAKVKYVFEADYIVYTREILDQCHQQGQDIRIPDFPILQKLSDNESISSVLGILATKVPDYLEEDKLERFKQNGKIPIDIPVVSVREWVEETLNWKEKNPKTYQGRVDDFKSSLLEDINRKDEYFNDRQRYRKDWIKRLLKVDKILKAFNPGVDVDGILEKIDMKNCPAVSLYWEIREKRMRSGNPPKDNDVDDYGYIPVIPYADIVLIEKNLREFIFQADNNLKTKVFSKVSEALGALDSQTFAW
jgi:hypothetical protein